MSCQKNYEYNTGHTLMKIFLSSIITITILLTNLFANEYQGNKFIFAQLKYNNEYNSTSNAWNKIRPAFENAVNVDCMKNARIININDDILFSSPFLCINGNTALPKFSTKQKQILKTYITGGGIILINNTNISPASTFDKDIRALLDEILQMNKLQIINGEHAIYKSFYLIKAVSGRRIIAPYLEGIFINGNLRVIYSQNDILSVWEKDELGNYTFECVPGGYKQRKEAMKLLINILVYSITGTYKEDVVHRPYLEQKNWLWRE